MLFLFIVVLSEALILGGLLHKVLVLWIWIRVELFWGFLWTNYCFFLFCCSCGRKRIIIIYSSFYFCRCTCTLGSCEPRSSSGWKDTDFLSSCLRSSSRFRQVLHAAFFPLFPLPLRSYRQWLACTANAGLPLSPINILSVINIRMFLLLHLFSQLSRFWLYQNQNALLYKHLIMAII